MAYGFLGSVLAAALGLAGGLAARSPRQGLMAAVIGGLVGAAVGAGAAFAMVPVYFQLWDPEANLMVPSLAANTVIFACIGAAGGFALALGIRRPRSVARAILGGVLGALAAAALVEVINAGFFPMLRVEEPIPAERVPRLICHLAVATSDGLRRLLGFCATRSEVEINQYLCRDTLMRRVGIRVGFVAAACLLVLAVVFRDLDLACQERA